MNTHWTRQWNAYLRYSVGIFVMMVFLFAPVEALAQRKNAPHETASAQNLQLEIFLTIEDDVSIGVYIDGVLEVTATPGFKPCPARPYNWGASNEGGDPVTECPGGWTDLEADQLYELEFRVVGQFEI